TGLEDTPGHQGQEVVVRRGDLTLGLWKLQRGLHRGVPAVSRGSDFTDVVERTPLARHLEMPMVCARFREMRNVE
ncbi:MAG: hypothetical protein K0M47_12720, partial [Rhizobium sp.]|nr:hypothetical protein [Rhizobium sp.]